MPASLSIVEPVERTVRLSGTIVVSDRQAALLEKSGRYIVFLVLPVLVVFRSHDYPPILAFGTCIAILIFLAAATLMFLLALGPKTDNFQKTQRGIQNDLGFRIFLVGLCAPIVAFFNIYQQAAPYALAIAAMVALGIRLLERVFKARPNVIDRMLGFSPFYDIGLALILFIVTHSMFAQPAEPQPSHAVITDWAVFYVAILRAWQIRGAFAPRNEATY